MQTALNDASQHRQFDSYCAALDASLVDKLDAIAPWLRVQTGADIIDLGAGTGALAARQAYLHPDCRVIGVDAVAAMVATARHCHPERPNLVFHHGSTDDMYSETASTVVCCSVLHEVYSYQEDSLKAVYNTLVAARRSLLPGGRLILRDFVCPPDGHRPLLLYHHRSDIVPGHDFLSFARSFARPLSVQLVGATSSTLVYETDLASAYEYLLRKDYHEMWEVELQEHYGFWTEAAAQAMVCAAGFSIIHSSLRLNHWITHQRLQGKVALHDPDTHVSLPFPTYQLLLVAEKPAEVLSDLCDYVPASPLPREEG